MLSLEQEFFKTRERKGHTMIKPFILAIFDDMICIVKCKHDSLHKEKQNHNLEFNLQPYWLVDSGTEQPRLLSIQLSNNATPSIRLEFKQSGEGTSKKFEETRDICFVSDYYRQEALMLMAGLVQPEEEMMEEVAPNFGVLNRSYISTLTKTPRM